MKKLSLAYLAALAPALASASIVPAGTSVTGVAPVTWSYELQLSPGPTAEPDEPSAALAVANSRLAFGSFMTIFDFAGYVAGSCSGPAGWICRERNVGFAPTGMIANDDPGLPNVTWVYVGGSAWGDHPNGLDLGLFSAQSIYDSVGFVSYAGRARSSGVAAGIDVNSIGSTRGPVSLKVPEPGSLALAGLALALVGLVRPRRNAGR